jgi:lysophospholipid acyltransferase (LPLAT)-like uncharacterized protein
MMPASPSSASPSPAGHRPRKVGGVIVPHRAKWHQRLLAALIYAVTRTVSATLRYQLDDPSGYFDLHSHNRMIFVLWHNRLALASILWRRFVLNHAPERKIAGLVSASKDGGLLAAIFAFFGIEPVRGSSNRRGPQALREMVSKAEAGYDLAITPDGPRGPCYQVQEGAISLAQLTGLVLIPVSYRTTWKIRLKSWDRFQIPVPFSLCRIVVGQPMRVPRDLDEAGRENLRRELEHELRRITKDD